LRAVDLYMQLGKRVGATMRQLEYPTDSALKGWCREYQRQLDLPRGYVRSNRDYSQEQKEAAVRH
jgi:transposase-like protein